MHIILRMQKEYGDDYLHTLLNTDRPYSSKLMNSFPSATSFVSFR